MSLDLRLGEILAGEQHRDAIHIAIAPVVATARLSPGQHIGFVEAGNTEKVGVSHDPIGIVDPFLQQPVHPEQRFWMFLYPNTITSLRHDWTHPAFAVNSEEWLRSLASQLGLELDEVVEAAKKFIEHGEHTYENTESYKDIDYAKWPEFWNHIRAVTGLEVHEGDRESPPFTCSC
jgi:hypothetical protein